MARVYVSSVIDAPAAKVWERVRDFNGLPKWHPRIRDSRIEDALPSDKVGCIRNFNLQNGDNIREQLLGLSDYDMFCTYAILESPMKLTDYIATLRLTPVTDGPRCFIEWSAEFECAPEDEDALVGGVGSNVFQTGFDALKRHFGSGGGKNVTINDAAKLLSAMYNDPSTDKAVSVHLFGIRHADQLRGMPLREIAALAEIPETYATEIRKGMNLARYVVEK